MNFDESLKEKYKNIPIHEVIFIFAYLDSISYDRQMKLQDMINENNKELRNLHSRSHKYQMTPDEFENDKKEISFLNKLIMDQKREVLLFQEEFKYVDKLLDEHLEDQKKHERKFKKCLKIIRKKNT